MYTERTSRIYTCVEIVEPFRLTDDSPPRFGIKLIENPSYEKQFHIIESLMKNAEMIINCGDADQEGELIQRWVMQKAGASCPVKRLWISSLTEEAIREGFEKLRDQSEFQPLYEAGLSRAMETAGKLVDNDELRDALKENGIGRPSTRAAIIETLFKRNYIRKERKNLVPTPTGMELIQIIHEDLLKSDGTGTATVLFGGKERNENLPGIP